ncbi:acyl-CoA dehydrogenase family protein [Nitriliruptor alkaliphilus]|uniref:acyl-CoA dehydrogenase family protein n=1 Tax=Nitriliruptor alkaliphilus TaxID=427918 RepID=UPI000696E1AB|nr:acyl-CoA dehydrogenase family protein [Nitriliruptor alkaliphilus]
MDLAPTPGQRAFRDEVRSWLRANVPDPPLPSPGTPAGFAAHLAWERQLAEAGYAAIRWPEEYGGRGADAVTQAIFDEEYVLADAPERVTVVGHNLMGPTLMAHGTAEQQRRWLPRILAAEDVWVQGYSEPEAGSDLAAVRTRAVPVHDGFVVDGQKIWTSWGANGDWIFTLVRTDPDTAPGRGRPKQAGISFLAIEMDSPGIEVRAITQPDGHQGFAEVFFTGVQVPSDHLIGPLHGGWQVAATALEYERDAPAAAPARYRRELDELVALVRVCGLDQDAVVRDRLADLYVRTETYRLQALRTLAVLQDGGTMGAGSSVTKLLWSELERDLYDLAREVLGPSGEALEAPDSPLPDPNAWRSRAWYARAATIYAGTSEIQRSILARRVLHLPKG